MVLSRFSYFWSRPFILKCQTILSQLSNGDLKKVEELCSQDFIDSAESSADVRISHSTVTYIDPNLETGSGTISFAVGKHKIKVRIRSTEP